MPLSIHLLGQPRLFLDEQPVKWAAPPRTLPLLAYLLLHRAQAVERAQVACALWPDDPEDEGRANLRRHLHQLQHALPPAPSDRPWLLSDAKTIRWNPQADCWLDVAEFERLSAQPDTLEQAAACYTGDLLETIYDDWAFFERERLRSIYLDVLARLVRQHRAQRSYAQAIGFAGQLLARDPFREDAVRQLVAMRYEQGDRAGAIHEYDAFARRLRDEMGVAPMPETQALRELVLRNAPLPGADDRPGPADLPTVVPRPAALLPFVGRDTEMAQATAWWSRATRGDRREGSLVLIGGEAGVGKTRLAREVALLAESQGGRVLHGGAAPYQSRVYQPVVEALEAALPLIAALGMEPVRLAALAVLLPELGRRRRLPPLPPLEPDRERIRLFDAVAGCLEHLARPRPLLVVLEDLHWAGEATIALIEFLAHRTGQHPILLLGTYREEQAPRAHPLRALRRQLQSEGLVEHLALGRLPLPAVECLLTRLPADSQPPDPQWAARLYAESEGLPLFVELLWQDWQEHGPADALPGGVRTAIAQRLERLPAAARAYAEVAAVVGLDFDAEVVREVGGWDEALAFAALETLLDRRLVRDAEGRGHFDYAFTHHLIQATLYAEIPAVRRQRRHLRVAHVLADLYPNQRDKRAGELAYHYDQGGDAVQAISHYLTAARQRLAMWADAEALAALNRALALADEDPSWATPRLVFDLLLLRENILHRRGERALQRADLERLGQIAPALDDERLRCEAWRRQVVYHSILGERQAEVERMQRLKACTDRLADPHWQAQAHLVAGYYHALVSEYAPARANLEQALALYQAAGDEAGPVACYCALADVAIQQGHFAEAQEWLVEAQRRAAAQSNQSLLVQTMRTASGAMFAQQDFTAAETLGQQMLDLCRTVGDREGEADALARLAAVAARLFRVDDARSYYAAAGQLYGAIGKRQGQAAVLVNTAMLLVARLGRYHEGLTLIRQADAIFCSLGDARGQAICALNEGMIALYLEDYVASRDASRRGLELARQMDSHVMEANALANLGAAERELGELDDAIAHMEAGLAIRRTLDQPAELGTDLCDLTVAYCRRGDLVAAQRAADEMLALYAQSETSMMHPQYMLWAAAQACHTLGDELRARELLDQAYDVMHQRTTAIPDPGSQASFYDLPFNRQIVAAHERGEWP